MKRLSDSSGVPEARLGILLKHLQGQRKDKAAFHFPAEKWVLPAASIKEPEEREFVVDSGASMHMVSKKDLNSAELETLRTSRSPFVVSDLSESSSSTTSSPSSSSSSSQESISDNRDFVSDNRGVENPVPERSGSTSEELRETRCMNPQKPKTKIKMRIPKRYKEIFHMSCLIGYRNSERIWSMKVLQQSNA